MVGVRIYQRLANGRTGVTREASALILKDGFIVKREGFVEEETFVMTAGLCTCKLKREYGVKKKERDALVKIWC